MNNQTIKIVVARYNEDITWTNQFHEQVLIINKGEPIHKENEITMKNVGREGHTYYRYIYDNYDNLDDYIIFLQGNPFDHSPNLVKHIKEYQSRIQTLDIDFEYLSERVTTSNIAGCQTHDGLPMREVYERLFDIRIENKTFAFGAGAQFIVSKSVILKRPREFYLNIVKMLEYDINPIEGFVIERFHPLIFGVRVTIHRKG